MHRRRAWPIATSPSVLGPSLCAPLRPKQNAASALQCAQGRSSRKLGDTLTKQSLTAPERATGGDRGLYARLDDTNLRRWGGSRGRSSACSVPRGRRRRVHGGDLLDREVSRRKECAYLKARIPRLKEADLARVGVDRETLLAPGEIQQLTRGTEEHKGGSISVDVLDTMASELGALAVSATWAFPGLAAAAVDIVAPSLDSAEAGRVTAVLPGADITEFQYPAYGQPRRCSVPMLNHMLRASIR